jgi:TolB-like protein/Tfp pilus assembly protein PilF/tRNA A-37 threonylcarbamoyl transferase component Bud32
MPDLLERLKSALADRYAVESEIGRGGMAAVFLAEDLKHHRKVAIKVLHPDISSDVATERFFREIEIVAGLTHPNILPLHDSGQADGLLYSVTPFIEGESLLDRLQREKQLPVEEALQITGEVADALGYAHERGIIHRDIKPANILLQKGHAVVADFGIARAIEQAGGASITQTGVAVGTPTYMSPEQASGEQDLDGRTDIYALGCVLYQMLAGTPPYAGVTPLAVMKRHSKDPVPSVRTVRDTIPESVEHAITRALAKVPTDRYQTAGEFASALLASRPAGRPIHRRRVVVLALVGVTALLAGLWYVGRLSVPAAGPVSASIAVLPFADMSPDKDQEYFSDGISEELLNLLAKIPELRVAARTSSFSFKGKDVKVVDVGRELNVAHVLEGSVRKAGNQVRITAQLIRADDGFHEWSDTWDRTLDDIFAIQAEIAADVAAQLKITLLGSVPTLEATDPATYALYLQARHLGRQGTAEGLEQSNALYEQALEIDPDYAAAWAGLARNYYTQAGTELHPIDEGYQLAREAANRALAIDLEYAPAYAQLGYIAVYDGDLAVAARHLERALALDPTNSDIIANAAILARSLGRLDEAIALQEYAVVRDPVNPIGHARLGVFYRWAGRPDEAIASLRTTLSLSPRRIAAQSFIGAALLLKGEPEAALAAIQQESSELWRMVGWPMAYQALGQVAESESALAELIEKYEQETAYNIAYVLALRGEADRAFEWLDKAVLYNDPGLSEIAVESLFANIHDDPRWLPFLESIGKSPEQLAAIDFEVTLPQ